MEILLSLSDAWTHKGERKEHRSATSNQTWFFLFLRLFLVTFFCLLWQKYVCWVDMPSFVYLISLFRWKLLTDLTTGLFWMTAALESKVPLVSVSYHWASQGTPNFAQVLKHYSIRQNRLEFPFVCFFVSLFVCELRITVLVSRSETPRSQVLQQQTWADSHHLYRFTADQSQVDQVCRARNSCKQPWIVVPFKYFFANLKCQKKGLRTQKGSMSTL